MIRSVRDDEVAEVLDIINEAARAYKGVIPPDCWHEPYMSREELLAEIGAGVIFWSYEDECRLLGVMGRQELQEVTLIRHAYVRTGAQRQGIGAALLAHLRQGVRQPLLVGTWAAAWWAVQFYQKHDFNLVSPQEKDRLLSTYWTISLRQMETSVVLGDEKWFGRT